MSVADNLARIRETTDAYPVKLIAVSKGIGLDKITEAIECGVTEFGESRVQDALRKRESVSADLAGKINWHFVGHLQTNKVKQVIGKFALIHSVDSMRLAMEVSNAAEKEGLVQPILLQVKIAEDPHKSGFTVDELRQQFSEILKLKGIQVKGLMTITPLTDDRELSAYCFNGLRQVRDEMERTHSIKLDELSMGMSEDYREAVRCGATMLRIGRAIFEAS
jgi:pyridoxal phosphate enzyme (YggS family)